jgi:hypothetical protein
VEAIRSVNRQDLGESFVESVLDIFLSIRYWCIVLLLVFSWIGCGSDRNAAYFTFHFLTLCAPLPCVTVIDAGGYHCLAVGENGRLW